MLTNVLGVDFNRLALTMLALVGLYLVVTRPKGLNDLAKTGIRGWSEWLVILQGRNPRTTLK